MTFGDECNCGNCTHFEGHTCTLLGDRMANCEIVLIERVGCLSHPRAREVMMADVIKTIELRIEAAEQVRKTHNLTGGNLFVTLYKDVLVMIRGGK